MVLYVYSKVKYTEEYEQSKGKGSFPAMITPGYEMAKKANSLASNVSIVLVATSPFSVLPDLKLIIPFFFIQVQYKKGHEERMSKYTTVTDAPDVLLAKNQGKIVSDVSEQNFENSLWPNIVHMS